jgi:hypothetical protein
MRERFCKVCTGWHRLDQPWPHNCREEDWTQRSELPGPMIIRDGMDAVQSMLDGKMYDSKRALRATYKAAGVTEVGNDSRILDPKPKPKPKPDEAKIRASVEKAMSRAGLGAP